MSEESSKPSMNWRAVDLDKEWKRFKQHCRFTFQGPLAGKSEVEKVNYLMTYIGDKGREIYTTFDWRPAEGDGAERVPGEDEVLEQVYARYDEYVAPQRNEIRATVNWMRRKQEPNECFEDFVTALRMLIKDCDFGNHEDRMLRDAIVLRSSHPRVQEKCLEEGNDLTLAKALEIGRNFEVSQTNMKTITEEDTAVKHVKSQKDRRRTRKPNRNKQSKPQNENKDGKCPRCGYQNDHTKANCPARNEKCAKCKKRATLQKSADGTATHIKYRKMKRTRKVNSPTVTTNTYTKFSPSRTAKREASGGKKL